MLSISTGSSDLPRFHVVYQLDGAPHRFEGLIHAASADEADILAAMSRFVAKRRVELLSIERHSGSDAPTNRKTPKPRRSGGGYSRIGQDGHERFIPTAWLPKPHLAKTDVCLDAATDPALKFVEYEKEGCWRVRIEMEALRRALETHPWREGKSTLCPFTIDVSASTVEDVHVPMTILWRAA
jgi:hypothetical protein